MTTKPYRSDFSILQCPSSYLKGGRVGDWKRSWRIISPAPSRLGDLSSARIQKNVFKPAPPFMMNSARLQRYLQSMSQSMHSLRRHLSQHLLHNGLPMFAIVRPASCIVEDVKTKIQKIAEKARHLRTIPSVPTPILPLRALVQTITCEALCNATTQWAAKKKVSWKHGNRSQ